MNRPIKYAGIAGIVSLILGVPITIFEILRSLNNLRGLLWLYIFTLLSWLIFYLIFIYGFKLVAEKYQNNLLKTSSYILIISTLVYSGFVVLTLILPTLVLIDKINILIQILALVIFGGISISFGIALLKLKPHFGTLATSAGIIEIIMGASFFSVIFSILGVLLLIPSYILSLMILFRAARKD